MKAENPFTLTFGKQPPEYVSRYENSTSVISSFTGRYPTSQTYLIEGVRGSGKTVLMTAISNELQALGDWVVADLLPTGNLLEELANRLSDIVRAHKQWIPSNLSLSVAGTRLEWKDRSLSQDSISVIEELLKILKKKRKNLLITIDEVTPGQNVREFASEFQILIRKEYPVFLIMTGLYENIYSVQNDKSLTFLLRAPKIHLEPLSIYQISTQYEAALSIPPETAGELARLTKGYAFAFQALGLLYFDKTETQSLNDILPQLDGMLDDFVYRKIWGALSEKERELVREIPEEGIKSEEIRERLSMTSSVYSKYRDRLIKKGVVKPLQYGYIENALPRFSVIIERY